MVVSLQVDWIFFQHQMWSVCCMYYVMNTYNTNVARHNWWWDIIAIVAWFHWDIEPPTYEQMWWHWSVFMKVGKRMWNMCLVYTTKDMYVYIYIYLFFQFTVRVSMTDSCSRVIGDGWHGRLWTFGTWTKRRLVCSSLHRGFIQAQKVGSTANYRHLKASWSGIKLGNISKIIIKFTAHWFLEG